MSNGLTSCITEPTRIIKFLQTKNDHLLININEASITPGILHFAISYYHLFSVFFF